MKKITRISLQNARKVLEDKLTEHIDGKVVWLPAYDKIVSWLEDNKNTGLILYGGNGLGKTVICQKVMPEIFKEYLKLNLVCLTPYTLAENIEAVNDSCPVSVDDVGLEGVSVDYGNRSDPFVQLVYNAERNNQLLILTTNLEPEQMISRYTPRIMDRLLSITTPVVLHGKSMRKINL